MLLCRAAAGAARPNPLLMLLLLRRPVSVPKVDRGLFRPRHRRYARVDAGAALAYGRAPVPALVPVAHRAQHAPLPADGALPAVAAAPEQRPLAHRPLDEGGAVHQHRVLAPPDPMRLRLLPILLAAVVPTVAPTR